MAKKNLGKVFQTSSENYKERQGEYNPFYSSYHSQNKAMKKTNMWKYQRSDKRLS